MLYLSGDFTVILRKIPEFGKFFIFEEGKSSQCWDFNILRKLQIWSTASVEKVNPETF